jgi:hypothetical protein
MSQPLRGQQLHGQPLRGQQLHGQPATQHAESQEELQPSLPRTTSNMTRWVVSQSYVGGSADVVSTSLPVVIAQFCGMHFVQATLLQDPVLASF